jgi:hypothetical protein
MARNATARRTSGTGRPRLAVRRRLAQPDLAWRAMQYGWDEPVLVRPNGWTLPAGATGDATRLT